MESETGKKIRRFWEKTSITVEDIEEFNKLLRTKVVKKIKKQIRIAKKRNIEVDYRQKRIDDLLEPPNEGELYSTENNLS